MNGTVSWVFEVAVKPGQTEAVRALNDEAVASTRGEPGTLMYEFFASDDGTAMVVYERFADSAAALAHVATFGERFAGRLLAIADVTRFTVLGDPSGEVRAAIAGFGPTYLRQVAGFAR